VDTTPLSQAGRRLCALAAALGFAGCASAPPRHDVDSLFLIADRSRDGLVSRNEFIGFSIAEAFARTDTQRDGFLTMEEFTAAGGSRSTFAAADRAGTGRIGVNDAQRTPALQQQMGSRFSQADTSRDGWVDKPEFVTHRGKPPAVLR
jgi:hypothetical protein